jgi:hypothetical protein
MPRTRKRSVTIRETTSREVEIAEEHHDDTMPILSATPEPLDWAPGWDDGAIAARHAYRAQRDEQAWRCAEVVVAAAAGGAREMDRETLRQAVIILRAGPGATPLELTLGRSV